MQVERTGKKLLLTPKKILALLHVCGMYGFEVSRGELMVREDPLGCFQANLIYQHISISRGGTNKTPKLVWNMVSLGSPFLSLKQELWFLLIIHRGRISIQCF